MTKDANISKQGFGFRILGCIGILFIDYLEKVRSINRKYYIALLVHLKEEMAKKMVTNEGEKVILHQDNALCHKMITTMAKLHEVNCVTR